MIGNGLMAIFGAPMPLPGEDGAPRAAVRAAQDMQELVQLFNAERTAAGLQPVAIAIGIAIATGDVIAGYTGAQQRSTYTYVGDTVNLAARLKGHTKLAGRAVLMDAATRAALGERVAVEALGAVALVGEQQSVEVFALAV